VLAFWTGQDQRIKNKKSKPNSIINSGRKGRAVRCQGIIVDEQGRRQQRASLLAVRSRRSNKAMVSTTRRSNRSGQNRTELTSSSSAFLFAPATAASAPFASPSDDDGIATVNLPSSLRFIGNPTTFL
jgi:hypothetical protein